MTATNRKHSNSNRNIQMRERLVLLAKDVRPEQYNGQRAVIIGVLRTLGARRKPVSNVQLVRAARRKLHTASTVTPEACVKAHLRILRSERIVKTLLPARQKVA